MVMRWDHMLKDNNKMVELMASPENVGNIQGVAGILNQYKIGELPDEVITELNIRQPDNLRKILDSLIEGNMLDVIYTDPTVLYLSAEQINTRVNFAMSKGIKLTSMDLKVSGKAFEEKHGVSDKELHAKHTVTYGIQFLDGNPYSKLVKYDGAEPEDMAYTSASRLLDKSLDKYKRGEVIVEIAGRRYSLPKLKRNFARIIRGLKGTDVTRQGAQDMMEATILGNKPVSGDEPYSLRDTIFPEIEKEENSLPSK